MKKQITHLNKHLLIRQNMVLLLITTFYSNFKSKFVFLAFV